MRYYSRLLILENVSENLKEEFICVKLKTQSDNLKDSKVTLNKINKSVESQGLACAQPNINKIKFMYSLQTLYNESFLPILPQLSRKFKILLQ